MKLRGYQQDIFDQLIPSTTNDIVQLDTGAGKTPIEAALAAWSPFTILVAHRNILIQQISEKLAAFGLDHDTISTEHTRRRCMASHRKHGKNHIKRGHQTRLVASMQSIISAVRHHRLNLDRETPWLIIIDEAHHVIPGNMWGQLADLFPNARIVGFTATPARMDGESLHVDKGGLFHKLVQASTLENDSTKKLIELGWLSPFTSYAARTTYNIVEKLSIEEQEQWLIDEMLDAAMGSSYFNDGRRSLFNNQRPGLDWDSGILELMGDPVEEYKRICPGRPAILMAPAIKNAELFSQEFRGAGIPAACINSTQSSVEIARILDDFRNGYIKVLTNVDMVGEGFDLPAVEVLIIATRTASFPRYRQWCGRVLRPEVGKEQAVIIDLTGMVALHGDPDEPVEWDLLNPPCGPKTKRKVPCDECGAFFLFKLEHCPSCGWENRWLDRSSDFASGSYQFDIRMIDQHLRSFVIKERQQQKQNLRTQTELANNNIYFGSDLIGKTVAKLADWFTRTLVESGVSIYDVNQFVFSQEAKKRQFYIDNFTAADIGSDKTSKAIKVYKKWLKQR